MKKICILLLMPFLLLNCGGAGDNSELEKITLASPERIRTKTGATVQLQLEVPTGFNGTFSWTIDGTVFSTIQNPTVTFPGHGTGRITATVTTASGHSKSLTADYFAAKDKAYSVGMYLPSWRPYRPQSWDKMTHVYLCFGTFHPDGSLDTREVRRALSRAITDAHNNGVRVLLSLGGGGEDGAARQYFTHALSNDNLRSALIKDLVAIVDELNLCGIDVDYEHWDYNPTVDAERSRHLGVFYRDLRAALPDDVLHTTAISLYMINAGLFTQEMHPYLDLVNLMAYDYTGPWAPERVGAHSHWEFYEDFIAAARRINVPDQKIIPGVPFYGVHFINPARVEHITYADITRQFPGSEHANEWHGAHGQIFYDGIPMIEKKTNYVVSEKLGGIMAWEITQDSDVASKSLLNVIDNIAGRF
jgi:chitinase